MNNPFQIVQQMLGGGMMNNPTVMNAVNLGKQGDFNGVEKIARNLCQQRGIDADKAIQQLKSQFGIR